MCLLCDVLQLLFTIAGKLRSLARLRPEISNAMRSVDNLGLEFRFLDRESDEVGSAVLNGRVARMRQSDRHRNSGQHVRDAPVVMQGGLT